MRKVVHTMGMAVSLDIPGCEDKKIFEKAFARLRAIDSRFSPYIKDSELSRYQRGEILDEDLSPEFKQIIIACKKAEKVSDGFFSAYYSRAFEPSGYVKGWAIAEAGRIIEKQGLKTYCVGAGGDILARSNSKKVWKIGIQDPSNKQKILSKLSIKSGAVATSGNYEQGEHIVNPKTGKFADKLLGVSVVGPDIITADVLATAIFAAGDLKLIEEHKNYQVFAL